MAPPRSEDSQDSTPARRGGLIAVLLAAAVLAAPDAAAEADDADDVQSRATLDGALPADAVIEGPVVVAKRPLASVSVDLSTLDDAMTVPVSWSGAAAPAGFASDNRAHLTASPVGIFGGGLVRLDLDLTADPDRPLVLRCQVMAAEREGQPHPARCGLASPILTGVEEAQRYLLDPGQRAAGTLCRCQPDEGERWTLRIPARTPDSARLASPDSQTWTLTSQGQSTRVTMTNGETSHTLRYTLTFEGDRRLRMDAVLEGEDVSQLTAGDGVDAAGTLAGRLRLASGAGAMRCEIHDPPPEATGDMFPDREESPSWQGALSCGRDEDTGNLGAGEQETAEPGPELPSVGARDGS